MWVLNMSYTGGKTFIKKKAATTNDAHRQNLLRHIESTLTAGNLREAVKLPEGEDKNEWLAVNTFDFFNQINMLYGTITEFCTDSTCPVMSAGPEFEYRWADGVKVKKPISLSAPEYVDVLMTWVQEQLDDEKIFPSAIGFYLSILDIKFETGVPFPGNFFDVVKNIFKRLFRIYAHIYHSHITKVQELQEV
jgi:MOB kinase activator 1